MPQSAPPTAPLSRAPSSRIPSTQALRALEAFARHGAVWQAADELNLTRSAVSHQLRLLERELGFALTRRVGTRIELTPQGRAYAEDVRRALAMIWSSARRQSERGLSGALTISCTPGFATAWLSPRIDRFVAVEPDVALSIVTPRRLNATEDPTVDVFITFGETGSAGMRSRMLKEVEFTPLCSPSMLNALGGLSTPSDLLRAPLLHLASYRDWEAWFAQAGAPAAAAHRGVCFSDMNLVYAAALGGQGVAMGDEFILGAALADGRLVRPFEIATRSAEAYHLAVREEKLEDPIVAAFEAWMLAEVQEI